MQSHIRTALGMVDSTILSIVLTRAGLSCHDFSVPEVSNPQRLKDIAVTKEGVYLHFIYSM